MIPNVLSIAGSDPSGGAGIQADLKTFAALGCHGMAAITALTAQNTRGVSAIHLPPADFVAAEIEDLFADSLIGAVKIGMLGAPDIVAAVARALKDRPCPIVLDPVLVATSGATLGDDAVIAAMREHVFPLATLITPNLPEASRLAGVAPVASTDAMLDLAERLRPMAPHAAWLIKGGHARTGTADDLLIGPQTRWFSSQRLATRNTHGTGCTLSAAITAFLAEGHALAEAIQAAKAYLTRALAAADNLSVGQGPGPVDHFADWRKP